MSNSINFLNNDIDRYECKPTGSQRACRLFYNKDKKTFLGRNFGSWCKILTFYFVYYLSLSAFFMSMMTVFMKFIIDNNVPRRTGQDSLLKLEPGLGFRPVPDHTSSLIKMVTNEPNSYMAYVSDIRTFLTPYEDVNTKNDAAFAMCNVSGKEPDDVRKVCRYNLTLLGNCNSGNNYGYAIGKPCVFLKMNKIYGWIPDTKDNQSPRVICEGQNVIDKVNLGELAYFPSYSDGNTTGGVFDHNFFPYLAQNGYFAPIVAVQFLSMKREIVVMVKCSFDNFKFKSDVLRFEMLID